MVLSKAEINKRYREKNSQKIKENRKKIDILCPDCNVIRNVRADVKRKTNLCPKCNMRKIRIDNGEILHGLSNHPLFIRWNGMKCRVNDKNLYAKAKKMADEIYKKPSAYKSGYKVI